MYFCNLDKISVKMRKHIYLVLLIFVSFQLNAQMNINGTVLYGNEWINYNKDYVKISVEEDGIYRVSYQELLDFGIPAGVVGGSIQIQFMGEQIPIFTSSDASWGAGDYLLFHGLKNEGEMDKHLYAD